MATDLPDATREAVAVDRSEGTTASFAKELVRRAVLRAALAGADPLDEHLSGALDDLMSDTESLTRSLLGVDAPDSDDTAMHPGGPFPGPAPRGGASRVSFGVGPRR